MADMVAADQLEICWSELGQLGVASRVVPITYINSAAAIKSLVGKNGGTVCTSSNAAATLKWGWEQKEKILFLPDQHLGRNTALKMGVPLDQMVVWDPNEPFGGLTREQLDAREADPLERPLLGARALHRQADRESARRASRHQGDRASRSAVRRGAGGRRQRLDGAHPEDGSRERARLEVGGGDRGPSRASPCGRGCAGEDRCLARPVRLPLLDDVPRVAESLAVGARLARRRRRRQRDRCAGRAEEVG